MGRPEFGKSHRAGQVCGAKATRGELAARRPGIATFMWQFEKVGLRIKLELQTRLALSLVQGRTGTEQHQGGETEGAESRGGTSGRPDASSFG